MFFNRFKAVILFFFTVLVFSNSAYARKLNIVTTNFPQYDLVSHITGEKADVTMLLKIGTEAHSFEPTPKDLISIGNSDLFVYNGGENDEWIEDFLKEQSKNLNTFAFMNAVKLHNEEEVEGMQKEGPRTDEAEADEHVWTSPLNDIAIIKALCRKLTEIDKDNGAFYEENAKKYIAEFEKLDKAYREVIAGSANRTMIFGDRFPLLYFAKDYSLSYYAAFKGCSNETEVSAATLKFLITKACELKAPVILKIELTSDAIASTIAEACGAKIMTFNSGHNLTVEEFESGKSMAELFYENLPVLKAALE